MNSAIRYCSSCGSKADPDAQFCGSCGRPFVQTDLHSAAPVAPPPAPVGTPVPPPPTPIATPVPPLVGAVGTPVARSAAPAGTPVPYPAGPVGRPVTATGGGRSMGALAAGCIAVALLGVLSVVIGGYFLYGYLHKEALRNDVAAIVTKARGLAASDDPRQWQQGAVMLFEADMRYRQDLADEDRAELKQLLNELHARLNPPIDRKETEERLTRAQSVADQAFAAAAAQ